jgi:ribosome biogenesis GTPase
LEEEIFHDRDKKEEKKARKLARALDRSKYKKTDKAKREQRLEEKRSTQIRTKEYVSGKVLSVTSQGGVVQCADQLIACSLKGVLKKEKTQAKNLIIVGDRVLCEIQGKEGVIVHVEPRTSTLSRADNLSRRKEQLIAANIDQVFITISVVSPPLKSFLVDRYLIAAHKGNMEPCIVVNKIDLLPPLSPEKDEETERTLYEEFLRAYKIAGVPVISVSAFTGEGLDELQAAMKDKSSVFSGPSGVGKSSLINAMTGLTLKTGDVVSKTQKGSHTTSIAHLIPLACGGWCIDTPGIKSFGVWNVQKREIEPFFREIHFHGQFCKFPNCTHFHEKECAVQQAVESGEISPLRFQSYLYLLNSVDEEHLRR